MSCNPAIGGLSKGNLVREVDALGGPDGHFLPMRLNSSAHVESIARALRCRLPRAQSDKALYSAMARQALEAQPNLTIFMDTVTDYSCFGGRAAAHRRCAHRAGQLDQCPHRRPHHRHFHGRQAVHRPVESGPGGRLGEPAAIGLGTALRARGFPVGRMKTVLLPA